MAKVEKKTKKAEKPEVKAKAPAKKGFPPKKAGGAKAKSKKKPLPIVKAPADFKPHFLLVSFRTEKDGLVGADFKATRYQGRFDRDVEDKKKFDLAAYDSRTLMGIAARVSAVTYKANAEKKFDVDAKKRMDTKGGHRLPASTYFQALMRVGKKSADQSLTAGIKTIWQIVENNKGRQVPKELDKKDPVYRTIRKASRILPAAFKDVQMPPKRGRKSADTDEE